MAQLVAPARGTFHGLPVGVLLCDGRGGIHALTSDAARLLDEDLALTDDRGAPLPELNVLAGQVLASGTAATVAVLVDRRRLWLELHPVGRQVLAVLRPVRTDVLRDKGLFDPVTGLPNRVLLFDRLGQALKRARVRGTKTTFVLAELSRATDRELRETADQLAGGLGVDHTVARYGSATFAVVVDHLAGSGVLIARRVVALAPQPVRTGWVTSDGTHSVHDVVSNAEEELQA
jgi:GGDEF domain-containing protein